MKLNIDKESDSFRQLFWISTLVVIFTGLLIGVTVGIHNSSMLLGFLTYFITVFIMTGLVGYVMIQILDQA